MKKTGIFILLPVLVLSCHREQTTMNFSSGNSLTASPDSQTVLVSQPQNNSPNNGIFSRITARKFSPTPVRQDQIDLLIKAGFAAPTGGNQHACEFIIVTDKATMLNMKKGNPYSGALDTAPLTIVVSVNQNTAIYPELLVMDAGIAVQSILVQASSLGLASVPMSIAPQESRVQGVSTALNLPSGIVPQIMISIGTPAPDAVSSASTSYYDDRRVHYNSFR